MSYPVKLSDLSARALQRANLEGATAFITPAELTDYVNGSIAEWIDEVRQTTWNGSYNRSSYTFNTSTNVAGYTLPADFLTMLSVDVFVTQGSPVISALPFQEEQRNMFRNYPVMFGWGFTYPVYYQLQGPNITFIPVPLGSYSVTLNYVPTAPVLTDPDDTIDSVNGWDEFIVLDVAIKCLVKTGDMMMVPSLKEDRERQRERIRAMAARRDQMGAEHVHVIANRGSGWDWEW